MNRIRTNALLNALATTVYVAAVGSFMYLGSVVKLGRTNTLLIPIAMLLLFVLSAAVTGFLIFGKPAQWYVDGKKKEALSLLKYTLFFFGILTFLALVVLFVFAR